MQIIEREHRGTVDHLLAGSKVLAGTDCLTRHNRALMILAVRVLSAGGWEEASPPQTSELPPQK